MKKIYLREAILKLSIILFLLLLSVKIYSQVKVTIYYDKYWRISEKKLAEYYREAVLDTIKYQFNGVVKDYYKNGKLQMKVSYDSNKKTDSLFIFYPNGNIQTRGYYIDNKRWGFWYNYYPNGKLKDKIGYDDEFICAFEYYDKDGNAKMKNGTGQWSSEYLDELSNCIIKIDANYKDTLRDGVWNYYYINKGNPNRDTTKVDRSEFYEKGKFLNGKSFYGNDGSYSIDYPKTNIMPEISKFKRTEGLMMSVYACLEDYPYLKFLHKRDSTALPVDVLASFPGGLDALKKYLNEHITHNYYKGAFCKLQIFVSDKGKLKIINENNGNAMLLIPELKEFYYEIKRLIVHSPQWIPAKRNNINVENYFYLFVNLKDDKVEINQLNYVPTKSEKKKKEVYYY